jgi:hypothetical protein
VTAAGVHALRDEYTRVLAAETLKRERTLSGLVNQTSEQVFSLLTQSHRRGFASTSVNGSVQRKKGSIRRRANVCFHHQKRELSAGAAVGLPGRVQAGRHKGAGLPTAATLRQSAKLGLPKFREQISSSSRSLKTLACARFRPLMFS